jgi:hypothetical protein
VTLTWGAMFDLDDHPERKIELIDGRLVIGNSLRGSSFVLWDLLASFSPDAVGVFSGNDSRDALESASSTPSTSRRKSSPSSKRRPSTSEHSSRSRLKAIRPVVSTSHHPGRPRGLHATRPDRCRGARHHGPKRSPDPVGKPRPGPKMSSPIPADAVRRLHRSPPGFRTAEQALFRCSAS